MRILVVTTEPVSAEQVRDALPVDIGPEAAQVRVVAPAVHGDALHFWTSDADGAIGDARRVERRTVERLTEQGVTASGDTGESDPIQAIEDALQTFTADRIVLFTHPEPQSAYKEDVDPGEIQERFGIPVHRSPVS